MSFLVALSSCRRAFPFPFAAIKRQLQCSRGGKSILLGGAVAQQHHMLAGTRIPSQLRLHTGVKVNKAAFGSILRWFSATATPSAPPEGAITSGGESDGNGNAENAITMSETFSSAAAADAVPSNVEAATTSDNPKASAQEVVEDNSMDHGIRAEATVVRVGRTFGYLRLDAKPGEEDQEPKEIHFRMGMCEGRWVREGDRVQFDAHLDNKGFTIPKKITGGTGLTKAKERPPLPTTLAGKESFARPTRGARQGTREDAAPSGDAMVEIRGMFASLVSMVSAQQAQITKLQADLRRRQRPGPGAGDRGAVAK